MRVTEPLPTLSEQELEQLGTAEPSTDYVSPQGESYENLEIVFPQRPGPRPTTTDDEPHEQLDQLGPVELWDELHRRAFSLPGVREDRSGYSFPETRALWLDPELAKGPPEAFIWQQEFAHIHPRPNCSWHLQLPWSSPCSRSAPVGGDPPGLLAGCGARQLGDALLGPESGGVGGRLGSRRGVPPLCQRSAPGIQVGAAREGRLSQDIARRRTWITMSRSGTSSSIRA